MYNSVRFSETPSNPPRKFLRIARGSFKHHVSFPSSLYEHAAKLNEDFGALTSVTDDQHISSVQVLASSFLDYIASKIEDLPDDRIINRKVLICALDQFEKDILHGGEIHAVAATLPTVSQSRWTMIQHYYHAISALGRPISRHEPNILREARAGKVKIFTIFGGQGNNASYFDELRDVYVTYQYLLQDFIMCMSDHLGHLSQSSESRNIFSRGLEPLKWLQNQDEQPDSDYLLSAPLSFPLIGLLQLSHYVLTCKILGIEPGELRDKFKGLSGHSQGIIAAVAVSQAGSWVELFESSKTALTILYWIGLRSQAVFPKTALIPSLIRESIDAGEGFPTPMLSIRKISQDLLQLQIDGTNQLLPPDERVSIGLDNGANNYVVCGPPMSLCGLNSRLRQIKSTPGLDQTRLPFHDRKLDFFNDFLPITAPFHSPHLLSAYDKIMNDVHDIHITREDLQIPVYSTKDGKDLRNHDESNILPELIRMITCEPLHWTLASSFPDATHILDFGPGDALGIGYLTQKVKDGRGARIISATSLAVYGSNAQIGGKEELFDRSTEHSIKYASDWLQEYSPRISQNRLFLDTKFSRLLGLPPLMVSYKHRSIITHTSHRLMHLDRLQV